MKHSPNVIQSPVRHRIRMAGHGKTLLDYLVTTFTSVSDQEVQMAVQEGRFRLEDGGVLTADSLLSFGQVLLADIDTTRSIDPFLPIPDGPLTFLHHDEHILAVDKPAGLLSYPLGPRRQSALTLATHQLEQDGIDSELRPLHRIDVETSGVLLMARTLAADRVVKAAFKDRRIGKSYLALVRGRLSSQTQWIDAPIGKDEGGPIRIRMAVRPDGSPARTRVQALGHFGTTDWNKAGRGYSCVLAQPLTGRTHQIRVHLAHLGHPIVGDKMYCDEGSAFLRKWDGLLNEDDLARLELSRHALHAWTVTMTHPIHGDELRLVAPIPVELTAFAARHGGPPPPVEPPSDAITATKPAPVSGATHSDEVSDG